MLCERPEQRGGRPDIVEVRELDRRVHVARRGAYGRTEGAGLRPLYRGGVRAAVDGDPQVRLHRVGGHGRAANADLLLDSAHGVYVHPRPAEALHGIGHAEHAEAVVEANAVVTTVPKENYRALVQAWRDHGRY